MVGRRVVLGATLALSCAARAATQTWPAKPITIVVPYAAGGSVDATARKVADALGQQFGQTVLVDNRPGGVTGVGAVRVATAEPDGYTLLLTAGSTLTTNPHQLTNLPYKVADFAPVCLITRVPFALVVRRGLPWTLLDFVVYAQAHPGKLNYGTTGRGAFNHLVGAAIGEAFGIAWNDVPYRGGGPATADVLSGQLDVNIDGAASATAAQNSGQAAIVAWTSEERLPGSQIPTLSELRPGFFMETYFGLFAPARTPVAIVDRLSAAVVKSLEKQDMREWLVSTGQIPAPKPKAEFAAFLAREAERYGDLIRRLGLRLD